MGGPLGPVEGPVWWKEGGYLLFSDIHASKRMKYAPGQGVTVFQEKTNQANGLTRDLQGRLLAWRTRDAAGSSGKSSTARSPSLPTASRAAASIGERRGGEVDGSIYFTDPWTSPDIQQQWDMTFMGVYRVTPDLGTMTLLVDDFLLPNGLALSPDEASSTSTIRAAVTSAPSTSHRTARSPSRPTACSPISAGRNRACLTA